MPFMGSHISPRPAAVTVLVVICVFASISAAALPATIPSSRPTTQPLLPIPSVEQQANLDQLVHDLFKADYAKHSSADRKALAVKLLQQARDTRDTRDNADVRYVLLREGRDLAAGAGDVATAMSAVSEMAQSFRVDATEVRFATLTTLSRSITDVSACEPLARHALAAGDEAIVADDYDYAARLIQLAEGAAERCRKVALAAEVQTAAKDLGAIKLDATRCQQARDKLEQTPDDPESKLVLGRHACFIKGDWEAGLPLLARGADAPLRALAQRDLEAMNAGPISDPAIQTALANAWWDVAQTQNHLARARLEARASYWYQRALPSLSGFDRSLADSRLRKLEPDRAVLAKLRPGLIAEIYSGAAFAHKLQTRLDDQINFDWREKAPGEGLPKDDFAIRWSGWIKVPRAGRYAFVILANAGARLSIDGKQLINAENATRNRKGIRETIELTEGPHALLLEYWDTTGIAKMILQWTPPGAASTADPTPIPPEAFGHEDSPALQAELNRK